MNQIQIIVIAAETSFDNKLTGHIIGFKNMFQNYLALMSSYTHTFASSIFAFLDQRPSRSFSPSFSSCPLF
jgi:hypothetical protein